MLIRIQDNPRIIVKPDYQPVSVTGYTNYNFIGSGDTTVTIDGNDVIIYTIATGATTTWGNITGTLSDQTDLQDELDLKLDMIDYNSYTGDTETIIIALETDLTTVSGDTVTNTLAIINLENTKLDTTVFNSHTGDTAIHFEMSDITGYTSSNTFNTYTGNTDTRITAIETDVDSISGDTVTNTLAISNLENNKLDSTVFDSHTGDTAIHFEMNEITGFTSSDTFNTYTGATAPYLVVSGFTASGGTELDLTDGNLTIYSPTGGTSGDYVETTTFNSHTGDTSIHFEMSSITGFISSDTFNSYTGSTDTRITAIETDVTQNTIWINDLESDVGDLNVNVSNIETDLTTVSGDTDTNTLAISNLENTKLNSTVFNSHTGDTSIHFEMSSITGFTSSDTFNTYTGNTDTRITAIETDVDSISGDTDTNTLAIANLENDKADLDATIVSLSTATTLDSTYKGKIVECDGTFTLTLPNGMDTGMRVDIVNIGTGTITLAASTTLQSKDSAVTLANQYGGASAYHRGSDVWLVVGDLS
jgi:hypothetical protein